MAPRHSRHPPSPRASITRPAASGMQAVGARNSATAADPGLAVEARQGEILRYGSATAVPDLPQTTALMGGPGADRGTGATAAQGPVRALFRHPGRAAALARRLGQAPLDLHAPRSRLPAGPALADNLIRPGGSSCATTRGMSAASPGPALWQGRRSLRHDDRLCCYDWRTWV